MTRAALAAVPPAVPLVVPLAVVCLALSGCSDGQDEAAPAPATTSSSTGSPASSTISESSTAPASSSPTAAPTGGGAVSLAGVPGAPVDVATGLQVPWALATAPGGGVLVSERDSGQVLWLPSDDGSAATQAPRPVTVDGSGSVPGVAADGEGGLLGLAVPPDGSPYVYAYLTAAEANRVVRFTWQDGSLAAPQVVLDGIPKSAVHNGGRLAFGPDGYLYVTTGDARDAEAAQDPESLAGKILRITADGAAAPGNPFPGSPVWSYGHRNVQGLGWLADGTMVASEFGQDTWDEVNVITPGANYGWPVVEGPGGTGQGFVDPVVWWSPSDASPSGLAVTGDAVYVTALRGQRLWRIPVDGDSFGEPEPYLVGELGRLRDVMADPDGDRLLVLTNNTSRGEPRDGDDRLVGVALD